MKKKWKKRNGELRKEERGKKSMGAIMFPVELTKRRMGGTSIFGIFTHNEKYKTLMKPGFEGRPFSHEFFLSSSSNRSVFYLSNTKRL